MHTSYTYHHPSNLGTRPTFLRHMRPGQRTADNIAAIPTTACTGLSPHRISLISLFALPPSVYRTTVRHRNKLQIALVRWPSPLVLSLFGFLGLSTDHVERKEGSTGPTARTLPSTR